MNCFAVCFSLVALLSSAVDGDMSGAAYIPADLEDCFPALDAMLSPLEMETMRAGALEDMILYHHGLGTWIRNNWGLWSGSRLASWFFSMGINHPDDMSSIILDSYWRHLNGQPLELKRQVVYYLRYWESVHGE